MQTDFKIRPAREADLPALQALLSQLFSIEQDFQPDPERQGRGLRLLLESTQSAVFAAEHSGRVVGMATVQILISTAEGGPVGLIEDVVVDDSQRGQGIGGLLLRHLEAWARERGLTRLQLLADKANRPALTFYEHLDWTPTSLIALRKKPE
jgi:GNAT superfamily N-acetyltransferase